MDDLIQPFRSHRDIRRLYDALRDAWATPHGTSTPTNPIADHDHWVEWFTSHQVPYEEVPLEPLGRLLARFDRDMSVPPQVQGERSGDSPQVSSLEGGSGQFAGAPEAPAQSMDQCAAERRREMRGSIAEGRRRAQQVAMERAPIATPPDFGGDVMQERQDVMPEEAGSTEVYADRSTLEADAESLDASADDFVPQVAPVFAVARPHVANTVQAVPPEANQTAPAPTAANTMLADVTANTTSVPVAAEGQHVPTVSTSAGCASKPKRTARSTACTEGPRKSSRKKPPPTH
jgi:hypothetical protein